MKKFLVIVVALFLFSCATGPVHMAKTEQESIKSSYGEARLKALYDINSPLLHDIYTRLRLNQINIYKEGIGFTTLRDLANQGHYYLMVNIRPSEIVFDEGSTKPEQRFSKVMGGYVEKYLAFVKKSDIEASGVEGLSLGIYWPVRDYSQCKENGGFLEYIIVYLSKDDLNNLYGHRKTFAEIASHSEIIASLDLKAPAHMKPVYH
ncbi:MAG: hypothetical protein C0392_03170 [Syntrophus sp. (in: bacteria)]|nr:hypothetical protein [Syntrophus sp. (in: bacteria)]